MKTGNTDTPHTLIVIVTYNRADVTILMLESLVHAQNKSSFEVFMVDNASESSEKEKIKAFFDTLVITKKLKGQYILLSENRGYAAANNLGIRHALHNTDNFNYICLLNNDTIVTHSWLDYLISHNINGLIGPVSNSVGNEQLVPHAYSSKYIENDPKFLKEVYESVQKYAQEWRQYHLLSIAKTVSLGFFCVLGPTTIFRQVGELDEAFGIGTYEDDDYCYRARKLGIPLIIARDVFIHHWGSASFSRLNAQFFYQLMSKNKNYFEHKHQITWATHITTTVEGLKNELLWSVSNPNPLSPKNIEHYEAMIKHQIKFGDDCFQRFRVGSLRELLCYWKEQNIFIKKWEKYLINGIICLLKLFGKRV